MKERYPPVITNSLTASMQTSSFQNLIEITIQIHTKPVSAIIDTGSHVTAISEAFSRTLLQQPSHQLQTLPMRAIQVLGAFGKKSRKITRQLLIPATIENSQFYIACLVIPQLCRPLLLGLDWLNKHQCKLNLAEKHLTISNEGKVLRIPFAKQTTENTPNLLHSIQVCTLSTEEKSIADKIHSKVAEANLPPHEEWQLSSLLLKYAEIFSDKPGLTHLYTHKLNLKHQKPIVKRSYPVPFTLRPAVEQKLREMEQLGIIERAASPYCSPMTVVKKKDGSIRICLDARGINEVLVDDWESPPPMEELLQRFHQKTHLTTIDFTSSYWQIPLEHNSKQYTAFSYNGRTYVYRVLAFGIKTAVAGFSRCMDVVLGTDVRDYTINYIDDLLITSTNFPSHLKHLQTIFDKIKEAKMTINITKSAFVRQKVPFLGHILTPQGILMDPDKIAAIKEFPRPRKLKDLRGFLGICNYYRRFCPYFSDSVKPLRHLLQKQGKWKWGDAEETAFTNIKTRFLKHVILIHPNPQQKYYLETDSSNYAVGGVLYQQDENKTKGVVTFISKTLLSSQLAYTTTEKELFAIVYAIQRCQLYLHGANFTVRTDHRALSFLNQCRFLNERLSRWLLFLQQFNFNIEYIPGKENKIADILSRYPCDTQTAPPPEPLPIIATLKIANSPELKRKLEHLPQLQKQDPYLATIQNGLSGKPVNHNILRILDTYSLKQDTLYHTHTYEDNKTLALPACLQKEIIWHFHYEFGHFGATKIYTIIKKYFYWPKMSHHIYQVLKTCDLCQKVKAKNHHHAGALQAILPTQIGEIVAMDYFGPLPKGRGGVQYILVAVDLFSKYVKLMPLKKANTRASLNRIEKDLLPILKPKTILTDHGTQFTARAWRETLHTWGIKASFTSIRHPSSNPAERYMKELGRFFRTYCAHKHTLWPSYIRDIENCFNNIPHLSTAYTASQILTGKPPPGILTKQIERWLPPQLKSKTEIQLEVRAHLIKMANRRRKSLRKRHCIFHYGDLVLLKANRISDAASGETKKFHHLYTGPYIITGQPYPNTYTLKDLTDNKIIGVHNTENLELYHMPN